MNPERKVDTSDSKPLDEFAAGSEARIAAIDAGSGLKNRLASMGLLVNEQVRIVRNDRVGQIIIQVKNSKVILGRGMSHKVFAVAV